MADNTLRNTDRAEVAAEHDTEPATGHDVGEGGAIGLVGGAIVGALAGGPVGAVIGAVAGGIASAGAVDVVDRYDHDYNRTVAGTTTANDAYTATDYSDYDTDYRSDYDSRYANTGMSYDSYQPAYYYGRDLAADPRYQTDDWNAMESGVRSDWETRYPQENAWDRFKDSVRYGWDRARNRGANNQSVGNTADTAVSTDGTTVYTTGSNTNRL
jgi:hypothetical protein